MGIGVNRKTLHRLQKKIYRSLEKEISETLGQPTSAIVRYQKNFNQALTRWTSSTKTRPCTEKKLGLHLKKTDIIWVADFHTYPQAQRTFLRVLRLLGKKKIRIGLEMLPSQHQAHLNSYLRG